MAQSTSTRSSDRGTWTISPGEAYAFEAQRVLKGAHELLTAARLELQGADGWPETIETLVMVGAKLRVLDAMLAEILS